MFKNNLLKSKTVWAAVVQFLIVFTTFVMGDISLWVLILDFVAMIGVAFYRDSIDANLRNWLNKFKFFRDKVAWTAIAAALGSVLMFLTDKLDFMTMLIAVVSAVIGIFIRSASSGDE